MTSLPTSPHASRGFTLIEAMVALVVLSIGLLGIAALYVETLRANRTSLHRTVAVSLAADIGDKMRANRNPADAYACGTPCVAATGGNDIADADLAAWTNAIGAQLPGGTAGIAYVAPAANTPAAYIVTLGWTEVDQEDPVTYQLRIEI